jgi:hypothetical protein
LKQLMQIMTRNQLHDGEAAVSDWLSQRDNSALASQRVEAGELNSYISNNQE